MSQDHAPDTPLDPIVSALKKTTDESAGMGDSPEELLDDDRAVEFPLRLYGREFTCLAWVNTYTDKYTRRDKMTVVLYAPDTDVTGLDDSTRHTDYIDVKHQRQNELEDADIFEDTQHFLATALGYLTRSLLDGRDYRFPTSTHDEPEIDSLDL